MADPKPEDEGPSELARRAAAKAVEAGFGESWTQDYLAQIIDDAAEELAADEAIVPAQETS